jgi:hypothetical protein
MHNIKYNCAVLRGRGKGPSCPYTVARRKKKKKELSNKLKALGINYIHIILLAVIHRTTNDRSVKHRVSWQTDFEMRVPFT